MSGGSNAFAPSVTDEPIIIMDGLEISVNSNAGTDATESSPVLSFLKQIPPRQIDYIKLLTGAEAGMYGVRGGHGVIEIHTTTKVDNYTSGTGTKAIYPKGFHVSPEFEVPDYTNKKLKSSGNPDLRTVIYWNGDVVTDSNGKTTISFFTADIPATYIVTVAGITANGDYIYKTTTVNRK